MTPTNPTPGSTIDQRDQTIDGAQTNVGGHIDTAGGPVYTGSVTIQQPPLPHISAATPRYLGFGALLISVLLIVGVWVNGGLTGQSEPPAAPPTATVTMAAPTATPQATPAGFTYGVTVKDEGANQPIANAKVLIEVTGKAPLDEYTDSNGFARLIVPTTHAEHPGRLTVTAQGYAVKVQNIDLSRDQLPEEVRLPRQ